MPPDFIHRRIDFIEQPYQDKDGFTFLPLKIPDDISMLHHWFTQKRAAFWLMQDKTIEEVSQLYQEMMSSGHATAYIGWYQGRAVFLAECYDPKHDRIRSFYDVQSGDLGMHVFIGPSDQRIRHFSRMIFYALMRFMFHHLGAERVVVEPDINNEKIHALNRSVGFIYDRDIVFPEKVASLAFCCRQDFEQSMATTVEDITFMNTSAQYLYQDPAKIASHLTPDAWEKVNRLLLRKAIAEYAHELIVEPERIASHGDGKYQLFSDDGTVRYTFEARELALRHWLIDALSIRKWISEEEQCLDALQFIIECRHRLGIRDELLPIYLDEISSTLFGSAFKRMKSDAPDSDMLAETTDFQMIEVAMTEGHPGFVANNGRLGFNAVDYHAYAPEAGSDIRVIWLAVHKDHATFSSISSLTYERLLTEEIGQCMVDHFTQIITSLGVDPTHYYFMPAHPWQWFNKLSIAFAAYVAQRKIICLEYGDDDYTAQQSIRTFFNNRNRHKRYVKTSLSILNMGFMRGLSPYYMSGTPAINEFIKNMISTDAFLVNNGFTILQEVASIGFRNHYYEAAIPVDSPYKKMFSALWRESPLMLLKSGERLMTMAALLHVDKNGKALLPELIRRSEKTPQVWLRSYLRAYLIPLLHCFYQYDLTFMPHGENVILVLKDDVPVRAIMKDIAEECAILNPDIKKYLPERVARLAIDVPDNFKLLGIFIDVFDGVLRHINQILVENTCCEEEEFWKVVANSVFEYQDAHPQMATKFLQYDMFVSEFSHSCLNRLQLGNNIQMVDLSDPASSLRMTRNLENPIAKFRRNTDTKAAINVAEGISL